ncbi:MAG: glycosyl transferase [Alphaproteobacteria bacterium]|nr:MAG: glycosyl transferase [Alphaproteobacteria bacterium]
MQKKLTIMQIIPSLGTGGAEQGCIDIAAEIVKSGARSIVVSNGGGRVPDLLRIKSEHINLPVHSKNPLTMLGNIARIKRLIKKHEVDIVHVRSRAPAWSAMAACRNTNATYVTTVHAAYKGNGNAFKKFYNSAMMKGERVIAISDFIAGYIRDNFKTDPRDIVTIPRGVDLNKFKPELVSPERAIKLEKKWRVPDGVPLILMPGRISKIKGHHVLIEALEKLGRRDIFCVMVGPNQGRTEYQSELESTITEKNLSGIVRIVDSCSDMPSAYSLSSIVVAPSIVPEGFGRIPIEAQAMGRPIIASNSGGFCETILDKQTGWLFETGDSDALAECLRQALSMSDEQRQTQAEMAIKNIHENFTKDKMCEDTMEVYADILRTRYGGL